MKKILRKSLFVFLSVITFGLVSPAQFDHYADADSPSGSSSTETFNSAPDLSNSENHSNVSSTIKWTSFESGSADALVEMEDSVFNEQKMINQLVKKAEMQSYQKFGTKIKLIIQDQFQGMILPNIEAAINETAAKFPKEDVRLLCITEQPGGGNSEKIFNVKNQETGQEILRFHVRKDNPPQEGFWFNFHYHTIFDDFQSHHELGSIYWSRTHPQNG